MMKKMIMKTRVLAFVLLGCLSLSVSAQKSAHPLLLLARDDVPALAQQREKLPLLRSAYDDARAYVDAVMQAPIAVPVPRDGGGGVTHEQHKRNYRTIHDAGVLYQLTGERRYAEHARDVLFAYADLYPDLGAHPARRNDQYFGKLFWQILNDSVWLVYSIQGYDAIIDSLSAAERERIEQGVFRPMVKFFTEESPLTIQRIHNHGTWALAAVGMTGYVLEDKELVEKALYGLDKSGNSGFIKQLDLLFSPDGYYEEGPYYQRYSLMPFLLFARAVERNEPGRKIFAYRDSVLLKAINTVVHTTYNNKLFPINNSIKSKGLDTIELMYAVAIAYAQTRDPALLSIALQQGEVVISGDGLALAEGLANGKAKPFPFTSMVLRDGPDGNEGVLAILRSGSEPGHQALVMKNTAQGMGHGHFDKLHWLFYDNGQEIIRDYGAARFLNIESKHGGGYLPENNTWAKTTIAHNTIVVDERSHFDGKLSVAENFHPESLLFDAGEQVNITSARIDTAYQGVALLRTMAMIDDDALEYPIVLDIFRADSKSAHQYDLPLYYNGHLVAMNFPVSAHTTRLNTLGKANGYQHLWHRASGKTDDKLARLTWLLDNRFYTYTTLANRDLQILFTEIGANDPEFSLRREAGLVLRIPSTKTHTFVSILEPHGDYNSAKEYTLGAESRIASLNWVSNKGKDWVSFTLTSGEHFELALSYDSDKNRKHRMRVDGRTREWKGFYQLFKH
jgi:hypothetical protein